MTGLPKPAFEAELRNETLQDSCSSSGAAMEGAPLAIEMDFVFLLPFAAY